MIMAKCNEYGDRLLEFLLRITLGSAEIGMSNKPWIYTGLRSGSNENDMKYLVIFLTVISSAVLGVVLQSERCGLFVLSHAYPCCAVFGVPDEVVETGLPERISFITEMSRRVVSRD